MNELKWNSNGLESLFEYESGKCSGILNGIDSEVWNPENDNYLQHHFSVETVTAGKANSKKELCEQFNLDETKPLIIFIGRLVGEKAADILPDAITQTLYNLQGGVNFLILGSGDPNVEWQLKNLNHHFAGYYFAEIGYNEKLSHKMYAGADFLLMPSRVEPCGLNQMYALRYGTVPMVRSTGGLQDTVVDFGDYEGYGIRFNHATIGDIVYSINRAVNVYYDTEKLLWMRKKMMSIDNSWENAVKNYLQLYNSLK